MANLRLTYDPEVDAAYLYIVDPIPPGESVRQVACDQNVVLDYNRNGELLGIEILAASRLLPRDILGSATK